MNRLWSSDKPHDGNLMEKSDEKLPKNKFQLKTYLPMFCIQIWQFQINFEILMSDIFQKIKKSQKNPKELDSSDLNLQPPDLQSHNEPSILQAQSHANYFCTIQNKWKCLVLPSTK